MAPSSKALITPSVLLWAREESGFSVDEVAQKLQIEASRLLDWEQGIDQPSVSQLRRIANIYKRTVGIFYLPIAPPKTPKIHDFRRVAISGMINESPQLRLELRKALGRRETAVELLEDLEESPPALEKEISISDDPERVANSIRNWLKLTYSEQIGWKDPRKAFAWWRTSIEEKGILVFQVSGIEIAEMRGFSVHNINLPIIAINIKDQPRGRIFTMLHELVHILLREGGICTLHENHLQSLNAQKVEIFCNAVAGACLIPEEYLELETIVTNHGANPIWTDEELRVITHRYQASQETALRRLLILGKTDEEFYKQKREDFIKGYEEISENKETENIIVLPHQKAISQVGISFVRLLLDGYNRGFVSASSLSEALGMKLKHINKLEQTIFS